jgi:hypothetical protein
LIQVVKNVKLIKGFLNFLTYGNAPETNITKLNLICDTSYHNPFFIFLILGVNLNSS